MISVVIPTHKNRYLSKVLEGLSKQTDQDFEVIVVENPDIEDKTEELCARYSNDNNILLINSKLGSNEARDAGIKIAKDGIIALLDDDAVPNPKWIEQIKALDRTNDYSVFGGPQINTYIIDKPKWVVNDFIPALSEIEWYLENDSPIKLNDKIIDPIRKCPRYLVSGNIFFQKNTYEAVGGLDTTIGYHGDNMISNDEIEFIQKCGETGPIMYSPILKVEHQIGPERLNLKWFRKRFYGQGYSDGDLCQRQKDRGLMSHYHDNILGNPHIWDICNDESIQCARQEIQNEIYTRIFIKNLIICKTDYLIGFQNGLGQDLWQIKNSQ